MPALFPDTVLPDVLDCLEVDDLLLSAMPVSRYWREQTVDHRTYWRTIMLLPARTAAAVPGQWHSRSIELFCLRLSRSGTRPIEVTVSRPDDAPAVLDVLSHHLAHIRRLVIHTGAAHWDVIFQVLRRIAAPSLESLALSSDHVHPVNAGRTIVPRDLFTGHAPVLSRVSLTDMDVGSQEDSEPPECFRNLISFALTSCTYQCRFPYLFTHCRQLKHIGLGGSVLLDDPAFLPPETWDGIASLNIANRRDRWEVLAIAMAHVRDVILVDCDAGGLYALCQALGTRLTVAFPLSIGDTWHLLPGRPVTISARGEPTCGVLNVLITLAHIQRLLPVGPPITAFRNILFTNRIAELVLPLENWGELVGGHHLTHFAFMDRLVLTVTLPDEVHWLHSPDATISCPRLRQLVLRGAYRLPPHPVFDASEVAEFAKRALAEAPFPIVLELDTVALRGSLQGFEDRFSQCVDSEASEGA